MLASFLDKNRTIWEKDYVWVKMDLRWPHAMDIMKSLRGDADGGVPWFAILDANGKVLATSNKSDGANIGFPSEVEEIDHFVQMFKSTKQRMTEEDLVGLKKHLKARSTEIWFDVQRVSHAHGFLSGVQSSIPSHASDIFIGPLQVPGESSRPQ